MNMSMVTCHKYQMWDDAVRAHADDFAVYIVDVIPDHGLIYDALSGYIGSCGATAKRLSETKTSQKRNYIKGSMRARYAPGSYTNNHTGPQEVCVLTISRNELAPDQTRQMFYTEANTPLYKTTERDMIGLLEYMCYMVAIDANIALNNNEIPRTRLAPSSEYTINDYFSFNGDIPNLIRLVDGTTSITDIVSEQQQFAIRYMTRRLNILVNG